MNKFSVMLAAVAVSACAWAAEEEEIDRNPTPIEIDLFSPVKVWPHERDVYGIRLNLVYGHSENVYGLDLGLVGANKGDVAGVQLNGFNWVDGNVCGLQVGALGTS